MGVFINKERVVRDGRLVAFEGEAMSEGEARKRGLLQDDAEAKAESKASKPVKRAAKK